MTYFLIFNSNINVQASFLLDRPRRDGKTGKGKNQGRGKEKNVMVEYIPLVSDQLQINVMSFFGQLLSEDQNGYKCVNGFLGRGW